MDFKIKPPSRSTNKAPFAASVEVTIEPPSPQASIQDPWESLFAWGDEFQRATGITPADVDAAVRRVRACKS